MSLRDISTILRDNQVNHGIVITDNSKDNTNSNNNNKSPNEKASKAYKLFDEGNKPVEVAIELSLSEKEATRYYTEYWRLKGLSELHSIYKEIKGNLSPVLKLYRMLKKEGIGIKDLDWFVNMVNIGTYKIPEIQKQHSNAKDELEVFEYKRLMSKHELDNMNNQIILLRRSMHQLSATCTNKRNEIAYLQNQIQVLEEYVCRLKNDCQQKIET